MCTKSWRARRCAQSKHVWSWTTVHHKPSNMIQHVCKHCGVSSESVHRDQIVFWRCTHGLLKMRDFFPAIWVLQMVCRSLNTLSVVTALLIMYFMDYQKVNGYAALVFLGMVWSVLHSAVSFDLKIAMEDPDNATSSTRSSSPRS